MALLHRATLTPSKGDLVARWLPTRVWAGEVDIRSGTSYRLDDPDGEVGMEGFLLTDAAGVTLHIPLTYRAAPRTDAHDHLLGTMEHSVLGTRWVYDGCNDPVWTAAAARTIATGGTGAEEWVDTGAGLEQRDPAVTLRGSGSGTPASWSAIGQLAVDGRDVTTVRGSDADLVVVRRLGTDPGCPVTMTASWDDRFETLAGLGPASSPHTAAAPPQSG